MTKDAAQSFLAKAREFEAEAHTILGVHEASPSRVFLLDKSYNSLEALNLRQDDLMRQALRCIENQLYRAAHVMAWAAFMDYLEEKLEADGLARVREVRPKWNYKTMEDLREYVPERQIVEVTKDVKLCTKNQMNALVALLNKRNECAHPSSFYPGLNETLGFMSELLQRISLLQSKSP